MHEIVTFLQFVGPPLRRTRLGATGVERAEPSGLARAQRGSDHRSHTERFLQPEERPRSQITGRGWLFRIPVLSHVELLVGIYVDS